MGCSVLLPRRVIDTLTVVIAPSGMRCLMTLERGHVVVQQRLFNFRKALFPDLNAILLQERAVCAGLLDRQKAFEIHCGYSLMGNAEMIKRPREALK